MRNIVRVLWLAAGVGALGVGAGPAPAPAQSGAVQAVEIHVDLSERVLEVRRGAEVIRTYPVAVGQPDHPTPVGRFAIEHILWNPKWVPPDAAWAKGKKVQKPGDPGNPMGRVKLFFKEPDLYIHGTRDLDSLGQAESHGCVRMRNGDVIEVAKLVMDAGGSARSPGWFQRVLNRVTSTKEVFLSHPVRVVIQE